MDAHVKSRRYAACGSFIHGVLWKRVCCSLDLLSRKSTTKAKAARWEFPEPSTPADELEAKGHLATPQRVVSPLLQCSDPIWFQPLSVPHLRLPMMQLGVRNSFWFAHCVNIVMVRKDVFIVSQPPLNGNEGTMLPQCEQQGHEGVALLPSPLVRCVG